MMDDGKDDGLDNATKEDFVLMRQTVAAWRAACARERELGERFVTTEDVEGLLNLISGQIDHAETMRKSLWGIVSKGADWEEDVRRAVEKSTEEAVHLGYQLGVQAAMANPTAAALGVLVNEELLRRA